MLLSSYFHGPMVVDGWIDWLQHREEGHDLNTGIGRQRESIDLLIAVHHLPDDENATKRLCKRLDVLLKLPQISKTRSVGAILSGNAMRMLGEIAWAQHGDGPFRAVQSAVAGRQEALPAESGKVA
jgi:hypothetical protein